jgi:hypothetical protein
VTFESDLIALREASLDAPAREMKVRHELRGVLSQSLVQSLSGDRSSQYQVVALYELTATRGSRPTVVMEVAGSEDLSGVAQGAAVTVRGWPAVGRAVLLDIDGALVEPTYPCTSPAFRAMRLK